MRREYQLMEKSVKIFEKLKGIEQKNHIWQSYKEKISTKAIWRKVDDNYQNTGHLAHNKVYTLQHLN